MTLQEPGTHVCQGSSAPLTPKNPQRPERKERSARMRLQALGEGYTGSLAAPVPPPAGKAKMEWDLTEACAEERHYGAA